MFGKSLLVSLLVLCVVGEALGAPGILKSCTEDKECGEMPFEIINKFLHMKCTQIAGVKDKKCVPTPVFAEPQIVQSEELQLEA